MDTRTVERIRQTNPWLFGRGRVLDAPPARGPQPWLERLHIDSQRLREPGLAHLVVGPRQVGKSSLVWSVLRDMDRPLFLNMEEARLRDWCESPAQVLDDIGALGEPPDALFFEEAQWMAEAGLFLKGLVDSRPPFPVVVTGSASFHLHARTRESLAGRATRHLLLPFSLLEVVPGPVPGGAVGLDVARRDALLRMLRVGGYPEAWLSVEPALVLGDLLEAFVLRDASDLFRVDRLDAYQSVLSLCARQVGNLVNTAELASACGVSAPTVTRYLSLMEEAHVIRLLPAFARGKRREVTSARKVYFLDNGLRNATLGRVDRPVEPGEERGTLLENLVFAELAKELPWRQTIHYWRSLSGAEVDFVVELPQGLLAIEVKSGGMRRPKLTRSARSFVEAYEPRELWVLNDDFEAEERLGATRVRWQPAHRLPDLLADWPDTAA